MEIVASSQILFEIVHFQSFNNELKQWEIIKLEVQSLQLLQTSLWISQVGFEDSILAQWDTMPA